MHKLFNGTTSWGRLYQLEDSDIRAGLFLIQHELKEKARHLLGTRSSFLTSFQYPLTFTPTLASHMHADLITELKQQISHTACGFFLGIYDCYNGHFIPFLIYCLATHIPLVITLDPLCQERKPQQGLIRQDFARFFESEFEIWDMGVGQQRNGTDCGYFSLQNVHEMAKDLCSEQRRIITLQPDQRISFNKKSLIFTEATIDTSISVRKIWDKKLNDLKKFETCASDGTMLEEEYHYQDNQTAQLEGDQWQVLFDSQEEWFKRHLSIKKFITDWIQKTGLVPQLADREHFYPYLKSFIGCKHPLAEFYNGITTQPKKFAAFRTYYQLRVNTIGIAVIVDNMDAILARCDLSASTSNEQLQNILAISTITLENGQVQSLEKLLQKNNVYERYCAYKLAKIKKPNPPRTVDVAPSQNLSVEATLQNEEEKLQNVQALHLLLSALNLLEAYLHRAFCQFEDAMRYQALIKESAKETEWYTPTLLRDFILEDNRHLLHTVQQWLAHLRVVPYSAAHYTKYTYDIAHELNKIIKPYLEQSQDETIASYSLPKGHKFKKFRKIEMIIVEGIVLSLAMLLGLPQEASDKINKLIGVAAFHDYKSLLAYTIEQNFPYLKSSLTPVAQPISLKPQTSPEVNGRIHWQPQLFHRPLFSKDKLKPANPSEQEEKNPLIAESIWHDPEAMSAQPFSYAFDKGPHDSDEDERTCQF